MNVTNTGTRIVSTMPLKREIIAYSLPENLLITGKVVSIDVAPPEAIPASLPKYFTSQGVIRSVKISREMFDSKATRPSVSLCNLEIKILERL